MKFSTYFNRRVFVMVSLASVIKLACIMYYIISHLFISIDNLLELSYFLCYTVWTNRDGKTYYLSDNSDFTNNIFMSVSDHNNLVLTDRVEKSYFFFKPTLYLSYQSLGWLSWRHIDDSFLMLIYLFIFFSLENRIWHFVLIVSFGDVLHEMWKAIFC